MYALFSETLDGAVTIRAFGRQVGLYIGYICRVGKLVVDLAFGIPWK